MPMNDRQKEILIFLIQEYIKSAQPVGSTLLAEKSEMGLSSATYRNELAALEEEGYLTQPHTSAGRIPTEKAYKFYAQECLSKKTYDTRDVEKFKLQLKQDLESDTRLKSIAKRLVEMSHQAVIVAFNKDEMYYTGLSQLFAQPEFSEQKAIVSVSSAVDQLDKVIDQVFEQVENIEVMVGENNPFSKSCATIVGKFKLKDGQSGIFAILGPMRMDYEKNLKLLGEVKDAIEIINKENI